MNTVGSDSSVADAADVARAVANKVTILTLIFMTGFVAGRQLENGFVWSDNIQL